MELFNLRESCMAYTGNGTRCTKKGSERYEVGSIRGGMRRFACCKQHYNMVMSGSEVNWAAEITPEVIASAVNQATLPGMNHNVEMARNVLNNPEDGYDCEIFYVRGLEPGKVLVLHKEIIHIHHWAKSIILKDAVDRMPNIEGRITGIMIRSGSNRAVWNRKPNGWIPRPIPTNLTMVINNEENK